MAPAAGDARGQVHNVARSERCRVLAELAPAPMVFMADQMGAIMLAYGVLGPMAKAMENRILAENDYMGAAVLLRLRRLLTCAVRLLPRLRAPWRPPAPCRSSGRT